MTGFERQEERSHCKAFEQSQTPSQTEHALVFLRREIFLLGPDCELTEKPLACFVPTKCTFSYMASYLTRKR